MKRILTFLSILFLVACTSQKTVEIGKIDFQVMDIPEACVQAKDSEKLLLAYFYTDW